MTGDERPFFPDGIGPDHVENSRASRHSGWLPLLLLGALLLSALLGTYGGDTDPTRTATGPVAALHVTAPEILRNGEFFEIRVRIEARRAIAKPVLTISTGYWRHLTINTMIPAPAEEGHEDGHFTFGYDKLEAGQSLEIKIDGQINPARFGGTAGVVALHDDKTPLARIPIRLKVFP